MSGSCALLLGFYSTVATSQLIYTKFNSLCIFCTEEFKAELVAREKLEEENKNLRDELNEAKSQVTIAEMTKENELQMEREHRHKLMKKYEGYCYKKYYMITISTFCLKFAFLLF